MLSWTEPFDYDDRPEPEPEWPGELPEYVEEWNQLWFKSTFPTKDAADIRRAAQWQMRLRNAA